MRPQLLPVMHPRAIITIPFMFEDLLQELADPANARVIGSSVTATVFAGVEDPDPQHICVTDPDTIMAPIVMQRIAAPVDGTVYLLLALAEIDSGEVIPLQAVLPVSSNG